ncbi:TonB-dependent receptor [Steroidobacter sp. S1-65]|uniref:TonB-dependent receptor n=1 Tax=Steroidobacter gossypii TaxID=2805490 RepID=A0ABS1WWU0_9GAMM|nr:TonB-dependent receptor [Steroidobacter gossypii]MBM0105445.1 TonB-dependent receptor [Steroidobacter gossypii]
MSACHSRAARLSLFASCIAVIPYVTVAAAAEPGRPLEEIVVTAPYGIGIDPALVPAHVQRATAEQLERSHALDLTDFLNRGFSSVNINHAQNNPLQPDFNFRGFTASPLLGLPQGLAVYQNGVRINEPFGDTINWDLVPISALESVQLMAGTQPVFGLNTLGGALSLRMKNGFTHEGTQAELYGGSFARRAGSIQSGGNNGRWGYYGNIDYFEEDGWRDYSKSDALRVFTTLSGRGDDWTLDLSGAYGKTELRGNGSSPVELLAIDREQVFTHPDLTENTQVQLILEGSRKLSDRLQIAGNVFYRDIDTDTFNGDGTIFEECEVDGEELLVEEEFTDVDGNGECSSGADADIELVLDLNGAPIEAELDDEELDAVNNIGRRRQQSHGASAQLALNSTLFGGENDLTLGFAFSEGRSSFDSMMEVARLLENRATSRTGIFAEEFITDVSSEVTSASLYFADTLSLSKRVAVTVSGRFDNTRIRLEDETGQSPELNGSHEFQRFNPAAGITFQPTSALTLYASYGQSTRAPSPVELACASEDAPCNLPNAFLADPPLDEVVAKSWEAGLRGTLGREIRWHLGGFHTVNNDDILFQTTGGAQANVGFFDNVSDTRRAGLELSLSQRWSRLHWFIDYSLVDATFEDTFIVNSPNHPIFDDPPDSGAIVGDDKLLVRSGATIPGIPEHQANLGLDFRFTDRFSLGADVVVRSGVYLRGDEANLLGKTDSYSILNLRGEYRIGDAVTVFARVENVFDEDYETFGLLGEPDEVFEDFEDPRFFGAGPPLGAWLGVKIKL